LRRWFDLSEKIAEQVPLLQVSLVVVGALIKRDGFIEKIAEQVPLLQGDQAIVGAQFTARIYLQQERCSQRELFRGTGSAPTGMI
jgi:hypothetical protein